MALVAGSAVVRISADRGVMRIRCGLWVAPPVDAGKDRIIACVRVTRCAHPAGIAVGLREPRVIERRTCPGGRRVAGLAGGREPGR